MRALALLLLLVAAPADADGLRAVPYAALEAAPHRRVTFDTLPPAREPGHVLDALLRFDGVSIGKRLSGQELSETATKDGRFEELVGAPSLPLTLLAGPPRHNMAVAAHAGFGSNALFPLGPEGADRRGGRGEGAAVMLFDEGQWRLGLRVYADYADPLGARPPRGALHLCFWDDDGRMIAHEIVTPGTGIMSLGWESNVPIRALSVTNTDPGGIAVDDILHQIDPATG
ncbi:hypothetical protein [uncultured Salipiger sp.]|uniref:hypothetical protein n=1 Tax=uncultured Salipiger sp. TaxID=499810 RepID=UPI002597A34E|nr:hypothetical protein [uncultured Salipiger sp.]